MSKDTTPSSPIVGLLSQYWGWLLFVLLTLLGWGRVHLWKEVPSYGDVLQFIWGAAWFKDALLELKSPMHYPLVFHPQGWSVGTFGLTPLTFIIILPLMAFSTAAFAFNIQAIASMVVSYIGAKRFFKHWANDYTVEIAALSWTFAATRSIRGVVGHFHILWMTALFGWLGHYILKMKDEEGDRVFTRNTILASLVFGATIALSLYSIFICPLFLLLFADRLNLRKTWLQIGTILGVGMAIGLTAILPILLSPSESAIPPTLTELTNWSTNLDSLFLPNIHHPVAFVREILFAAYSGYIDESGAVSIGIIGTLLAVIGLRYAARHKGVMLLLAGTALMFTLGPFFKVGGSAVALSTPLQANLAMLELGESLKPAVFTEQAIQNAQNLIPLPYSLLVSITPELESARTIARFAYVVVFAAFTLALVGLKNLPRWLAIGLSVLWLFESLPSAPKGLPVDLNARHPAYEWLTQQSIEPGYGILDMTHVPMHGGEMLYSSYQTGVPTAGFIGSFLPETGRALLDYRISLGFSPEFADILNQYRIQYLYFHMFSPLAQELWDDGTITDVFPEVGCFDPQEGVSPFPYPICVAEVPRPEAPVNVLLEYGLSAEPWGIWTTEPQPRARIIAFNQSTHTLTGEAFPHCIEGRNQSLRILFNDREIDTLNWTDCEPKTFSYALEADEMIIGLNEIKLEPAYALSQTELGIGSDPRQLGVGFSRLLVLPEGQ